MLHAIKRLAGQTAIYGLSSIVGRLLNFLLVPLYTRLFDPPVYGVVNEFYTYIGFLLVFLTYGLETGYFRFTELAEHPKRTYNSLALPLLFTSSIFVLLVYLFLQPISSIIGYSKHPEYILYAALIVAIDAFVSLPFAKLRLQNKAIKFATIKVINIFLNIGLNLFFLVLCPYLVRHQLGWLVDSIYSPELGITYIFISNLLANVITLLLLIPDSYYRAGGFDFAIFKKVFNYSFPLLFTALALVINQTLDRVLLKYFVVVPAGVINTQDYIMAQVGIYSANYKLAILMSLFIQTFRYAADPFFFSIMKNSDSKKIYATVMNYFIIFCLLIFLAVMLYLDILKFYIDQDYHSGIVVVPVLMMALLFYGISFNLSLWYKFSNLTRYGAYIAFVGAVITIGLNLWLIPQVGYIGSAWASFFSYLVMMILSYIGCRKYYPIDYDLKRIAIYFTIALIIFFINQFQPIQTLIPKLIFNTAMLAAFTVFVAYRERLIAYLYHKFYLKK